MKKRSASIALFAALLAATTFFSWSVKSEEGMKAHTTLVTYFSCSGTTERVAETIARHTGATVHRITPEQSYTAEDLNYRDPSSRSSKEHNDQSVRPGIADPLLDASQYDVIYLGYPIWWGEAPNIIHTFLESHDLTGKTIIPFATSHSSGLGSSDTNLHPFAPAASWIPGKRFSRQSTDNDIVDWVNGMRFSAENNR